MSVSRGRWALSLLAAGLLWLGCDGSTGEPDDDDVSDDDDDDVMDDDDDDTGEFGDPIEQLDTYDGPSFAELLEVVTWGDRIAFCSGVQGLNLYDASDPEDLQVLDGSIGFDVGSQSYPRCQHLAVDEDTDRIYTATHRDQIQTTAFLAVMDASDPANVTQLGSQVRWEEVEGLTVAGDLLLVAAHGEGLIVFERGDGAELDWLTQVDGITFTVVRDSDTYNTYAWPPAISPYPRQALAGRDGTVRYLASENVPAALEAALADALAE